MNEDLWRFIDATGDWVSKSYGLPRMTGRVFAWLLVCDPPEQTAAQLAEALDASKGSISGATSMLVRFGLVDRVHVRGERADRFRLRPDAWDAQIRDPGSDTARALVALGLEALAGEPAPRRARLEEMDAMYAWYQSRMPALLDEWREYKRTRLGGGK
ncbi:MAG: MarR family transcriptional regulator [Actinobacteria bacterium]|nr:MAG: MarR family transcriptional regulator [Actinomycetota bacterium]